MKLQQVLDYLGVSQSELARKIGQTPQAVSRLCSGCREPSVTTLQQIAAALAVRIEINAEGWHVKHSGRRARV